ncbi:MAG TPA: MFS transporter [Mycobacteriales bacterium]|nr:MFS transporter [Mycobacteriales bacterium]
MDAAVSSPGLAFFRPFLPLFGTIFFCLLSVGASLATLPFYVTDKLGGGNLAVGFVVATIAVAAIVARPIAGRLADSRGYKPIFMAGAVTCSLAGVLYFASLHVAVLVPVRLVHGIGEAAVYTAGAAWLVSICPPARRGRVVGLYGTAMWLGITLGALFGELLRDGIGYGAVWSFCIVMPLIGLGIAAATPPPSQVGGAAKPVLVPRGAVVPGIALSLASLGYGALAAFVALHLSHKGIAGGIAAFNAYGIAYVGVRLVLGNWPDRFGPRRVAFWSGLVEAVGLLLVAMAPNLAVAVVGGFVMGSGLSLLFPALALIVINQTAPSQQGGAIGTFTSFWDLGVALGGPLGGIIVGISDYPQIFYVMLVAAIASAALGALPIRSPAPEPEARPPTARPGDVETAEEAST